MQTLNLIAENICSVPPHLPTHVDSILIVHQELNSTKLPKYVTMNLQ